MNDKLKPWFLWSTLILLCCVQLGTTADNAVLSNATRALVSSFHVSISTIQVANAIYPLTAGALMIAFGLLGLIVGWKRLLVSGLAVLTISEVVAFASPNITVFSYGARLLTGVGASMAIAAVLGLIASIYTGKHQAIAFSAIAGANGIATALGPIVGGGVIVYMGWRIAFLLLAIFFGCLFVCSLFITKPQKSSTTKRCFDFFGTVLIAISLVLFCGGLLQVNEWGAFIAKDPKMEILGLSPCIPLICGGLLFFWLFNGWEKRREKRGHAVLLPGIFLKTPAVRSGLYMTSLIFIIFGSFTFLIVTFLQMVVDYNAIQTGIVLIAFAVGMLLFSLGTSFVLKTPRPRLICRLGIIIAAISCLCIAIGMQRTATNWLFLVGLFVAGAGSGLIASQASIVITFSVPKEYAEQSSGIQGTMRNVGQAIGIACIGLVLIMSLSYSIKSQSAVTLYLSKDVKDEVALVKNISFISNKRVDAILTQALIPETQKKELIKINEISRLIAARTSLLFLTLLMLLFLLGTNGLPKKIDT